MKALAIDSATNKLVVAARDEDRTVSTVFDIGSHQSETLLPAIDYVMGQLGIKPEELDYTAICEGPGSFTGLRLGFSAVKAIQTAHNVPIYGVSTLKAYALPYFYENVTILVCIDAKKDRFYAATYKYGEEVLPPGDYTPEEIAESIKDETTCVMCGPDAQKLKSYLISISPKVILITELFTATSTDCLFYLAEDKIDNNEPPMEEFEGPKYIRASEAETKKKAEKGEKKSSKSAKSKSTSAKPKAKTSSKKKKE